MNCDLCGIPIDYNGLVYQVDVQEWLLNRAAGRKFTLCPRCGESLDYVLANPVLQNATPEKKENEGETP